MRKPLSQVYELHVESSDSCNLNCKYCYFTTKKTQKTDFPLNRFRELMDAFFAQTSENVNLVFHGGEPLMNSAKWLNEACDIAEDVARNHQKLVGFHLQTNGTLLTDDHVAVLRKHGFTVNVSLDGPKDIHNSARGLYLSTVQSVKRLQEAGVFMGTITVIGKHNFDKTPQIVEHLIQLGVKRYHFNIGSILSPKPELILTAEEIRHYYQESFQTFLKTYQQSCNWVLLGKLRRYLSGEIPQFACDSPLCGAGIYKIHLLPNGDYYPCGSCVNTAQGVENMRLGNIFQPLSYDDYQRKLVEFQAPYFANRDKCEHCPATVICDFLCPAFDPLDKHTMESRCGGSQMFFDYLATVDRSSIQQVVSYYADCHE